MTRPIITSAEEDLLAATAKSIARAVLEDDAASSAVSAPAAPASSTNNNNNARNNLRSLQITHTNTFSEKDGDNSLGDQGGQSYAPPTRSPTPPPTAPPTPNPTTSPTSRPTLAGRQHILRGAMWYDRNANGARDSNVSVEDMGNDVEFSHGVGGVSVQVIECDGETGREYVPPEGETLDSYASTTTIGTSVRNEPQIVPMFDENGKFNIFLNGINRYYYVQVTAPAGFLFTSGLCNDSRDGWQCDYSSVMDDPDGSGTRLLQVGTTKNNNNGATHDLSVPSAPGVATDEEKRLGIRTGRSTSCVFVDSEGRVEAPINFGVMKLGDTREVGTNVALMLEFDEDKAAKTTGRKLAEVLKNARVLDEVDDGHGTITTRYLLGDSDKEAIGLVTAEVLASTLDTRLSNNGIELDSVNPKEVILSNARPSDAAAASAAAASAGGNGNQLAVAMEIRGHYSPPPELDFDYIVQDSINRDTGVIRRNLRDFNTKCREQTTKVNAGSDEGDFAAVVSNSGALRPGRGGGRPVKPSDLNSMNNVFSTACSSGFFAPSIFETSLKEIEARDLSEVKFKSNQIVYVAEESRGLDSWAMGPVAGIAGLIVLLVGAFVFRRALGPRRVDKYSDVRKTKAVDGDEERRRFGEMGGDMDDGSVDSAFYSDSDEDIEETEKERKMRRKRKEKEDEQTGGDNGRSSSKAKSGGRKGKGASKYNKKLAVSTGSDDTESLGKSSTGNSFDKASSSHSEEFDENSKGGRSEKKRSNKERGEKKKSSSSSKRREGEPKSSKSKRGRNKKSGGDNARIV